MVSTAGPAGVLLGGGGTQIELGEAGGDLDRLSGELGFAAQRATRASPALWALRSRSGTIMTIGAR
ncbi:hypothetical protein [Mesorhizobium sp. M0185]|uniref:hypothetical protein n=1 Tax=unclassified Mesorhizobium TaxID=325217 RepID=UPI00333AC57F